MSKKIIITGGLGYIGTELCKLYSGVSWNNKILVIDNKFNQKVNKTLKTLCFWGTEIYDPQAMSDMLKVNTTLEELEISEQECDSWHWYLLAPGLKANKSLKTLKLWSVWFDEDGISNIAYAIKDNSHANLNHLDDFKTEVKYVKSKKR